MATVTYIKETKQHVSAMKAVMRYCQRQDKTTDPKTGRRYVSGLNCNGPNSFTEFLATKTAYNKLDGINFYQYVQSFSPKEQVTYEQAHEIGLEFAAKAWPGHGKLKEEFFSKLSAQHSSAVKEIQGEYGRQKKENLRFMLITIASSAVLSGLVSGLFLLLGG